MDRTGSELWSARGKKNMDELRTPGRVQKHAHVYEGFQKINVGFSLSSFVVFFVRVLLL